MLYFRLVRRYDENGACIVKDAGPEDLLCRASELFRNDIILAPSSAPAIEVRVAKKLPGVIRICILGEKVLS
jgi:hypothetical protein